VNCNVIKRLYKDKIILEKPINDGVKKKRNVYDYENSFVTYYINFHLTLLYE